MLASPFVVAVLRYWKAGLFALVCLLLAVQTVRLGAANNRADRLKIDNNELRAEIKSISDKRNEQAETTRGNIKRAEEGERKARDIADEIRAAPIPPNCETPGIEILRNEI